MDQDFPEEVIIERRGCLGVITLNRPQALNALSLEMIRSMSAALHRWERDPAVKAVFFCGAPGGRAFSAGGDLKAFYRSGMDFRRGKVGARVASVFFAEEYSLNRQIFHFSKPTIAVMNGITMGGGFGVAGNCAYKIATERTLFAMPEVSIGFFPDVGSIYHLLRCPGHIGHYLALTGMRLAGADVFHAGVANYFIAADREAELLQTLENGGVDKASIDKALDGFSMKSLPPFNLSRDEKAIDSVFSHSTVHAIFSALANDQSAWAASILSAFRRSAPASVMVTAAHLARSAGKSFDDVMRTDFILAQRFVERGDLYEGIRSVLIDKDDAPEWSPTRYEDMSDADADVYFEPTGYSLDDIQIFATE